MAQRAAASSCSDGPIAPWPYAFDRPAARRTRAYASVTVSPPAITSPVERISGRASAAPGKRSAGKIASFAHARVGTRALGEVELAEPRAEHEPAGMLDERHAGRLGDERHRPRRARVRLDHAQLAVAQRELQVEEAAHAEPRVRARCDLADLDVERRRHRGRRDHAGRVAGVDPCRLDVLEDPPRPSRLAVAEHVDVELERALEELVDERRLVLSKLVRAANHPHPPAAEHVVRPHEHRVPDPLGDLERLLPRLRDAPARCP